mmetsp:Transcript_34652/g.70732  ORF Transcript_34652/g.70732 Transcript_34652/m.70732 type:complete len:301 (-) Transcript_34652:1106-2008(-)
MELMTTTTGHFVKCPHSAFAFEQQGSALLPHLTIELPVWRDSHGPVELVPQGFAEYLLDGDLVPLAPSHTDPWVHVVDLGSTQADFLVVVLVLQVQFHLGNLGVPHLYSLCNLLLRRDFIPEVRLVELQLSGVPLLLLCLLVRLRCRDLLLIGSGLVLHSLGSFHSLVGLLHYFLLIFFDNYTLGAASIELLQELLEHLLLIFERFELLADVVQLCFLRLAHGPLMVTKDCNLTVGVVVLHHLFRRCQRPPGTQLLCLAQLVLQSLGGIVGTEHLRRQPLHNLLQVCIECGGSEGIKHLF